MHPPPPQPRNSFRVILTLTSRCRLDSVLLEALKGQNQNSALKHISRRVFKALFKDKRIQIKGQCAVPSSIMAVGTTYVDILGYEGGAIDNTTSS